MNLISILLLAVIVAAVAFIIIRRFRSKSKSGSCCDTCDVEGCSLRDLLRKRTPKQDKQ